MIFWRRSRRYNTYHKAFGIRIGLGTKMNDDSRIAQELQQIDGVRARLTDVIDDGIPLPESHWISNALEALYVSRLWLLKTTPPSGEGSAA